MRTSRKTDEQRRRRAGAIGVLALVIVATIAYVAYDALNGLPLESRYHVNVVLPDADRLITADDVKIGGVRVGQIAAVDATPATAGAPPTAVLRLSLDRSIGPVAVDSTVRVRSASPLGATYLELVPGRSRATIADGGTLRPPSTARTPNLVDLYDIFDRSARRNFQSAVRELSGGFAGRGRDLNVTIGALSALLPHLARVSQTLAAPATRLVPFIHAYSTFIDALAPASAQLAEAFTNGAATMRALASQRASLDATIAAAPATELAATDALRAARPSLDRLARLTTALRPATRHLPAALTAIDVTVRDGTPVLRDSGRLTHPLERALAAITTVAGATSTDGAVRKLSEAFSATNDVLEALLPAQRQCNLIPLFFQQFASYIGVLGAGNGPAMINVAVDRPAARGEQLQSAAPAPDLHVNYLPHENAGECEAGNEPFDPNTQKFDNPAGLQPARTRESTPPPHVLELARSAGLLATGGAQR